MQPNTEAATGRRKIIPWPVVQDMAGGKSRVQIRRDIKAGIFPAAIDLSSDGSGRKVGWYEDEIIAWQESLQRRTYGAEEGEADARTSG